LRPWAHAPVVVAAGLSCIAAIGTVSMIETGISRQEGGDSVQSAPGPVTFPKLKSEEDRIVWFGISYGQTKLTADLSLTADHLTGIMLLVITFVGLWIVVFSIGYMRDSPGYPRYFAIVSLFLAAMTLLVLADNFLLMYAGWEGVGLCSYLLVGYWH